MNRPGYAIDYAISESLNSQVNPLMHAVIVSYRMSPIGHVIAFHLNSMSASGHAWCGS